MVANDDSAFGRENRARQRSVIADLNRRVLAEAKHGADIDPSVMPNRNGDRLPAVAVKECESTMYPRSCPDDDIGRKRARIPVVGKWQAESAHRFTPAK